MTAAVAPLSADQMRRAAWLEDRKTAITGTDAGKILTGKGIDVWLEKTGKLAPQNDAELPDYMRAGRYFERSILTWYADSEGVGLEFQDPYTLHRMANVRGIGATLDARRTAGDRRPVDAKNIGIRHPYDEESGAGWGVAGSDKVPLYYAAQLVIQMAVTDAPAADLAVVFGGNTFARFTLERDVTIEGDLITRLLHWWTRHVVLGEVPPVDGSDAFTDYLKKYVRQRSELTLEATTEDVDTMEAFMLARDAEKTAKGEKDGLGNVLRARIGEASTLVGGGYKASWNKSADGVSIDWEAIARELAEKVAVMAAEFPNTVEQGNPLLVTMKKHTTPTRGERRLLVKPVKEKK